MSAMLMFTIMGVATDDRAEGAMAGIAIGAVIALEAAFGGPISGARAYRLMQEKPSAPRSL